MTIFGRAAFSSNKSYAALAALTNILGTLVGGVIQIFFLSDHRRPVIHSDPGNAATHAASASPGDEPIINAPMNTSSLSTEKGRFGESAVEHREYNN